MALDKKKLVIGSAIVLGLLVVGGIATSLIGKSNSYTDKNPVETIELSGNTVYFNDGGDRGAFTVNAITMHASMDKYVKKDALFPKDNQIVKVDVAVSNLDNASPVQVTRTAFALDNKKTSNNDNITTSIYVNTQTDELKEYELKSAGFAYAQSGSLYFTVDAALKASDLVIQYNATGSKDTVIAKVDLGSAIKEADYKSDKNQKKDINKTVSMPVTVSGDKANITLKSATLNYSDSAVKLKNPDTEMLKVDLEFANTTNKKLLGTIPVYLLLGESVFMKDDSYDVTGKFSTTLYDIAANGTTTATYYFVYPKGEKNLKISIGDNSTKDKQVIEVK